MRRLFGIILVGIIGTASALFAKKPGYAETPNDIDFGLKEVTVAVPMAHWEMVQGMAAKGGEPFPNVGLSLDPDNHRLLLKGPPIQVQAVREVVASLDDGDYAATRTRKMEHASPEAMAQLLNDMFSPTSETQRYAGGELICLAASDGKSMIMTGGAMARQRGIQILNKLDVGPGTGTQPAPVAKGMFQFEDTTIDQICGHLESTFGIFLLRPAKTIGARVTVRIPEPISAEQAIKVSESFLGPIGFKALWGKVPGSSQWIMVIEENYDARLHIPVFIGNDPAKIPDSPDFITQIIPLEHAKGEELISKIELLQKHGCVLQKESNTLRIFGTSSDIRQCVEAIRLLDK